MWPIFILLIFSFAVFLEKMYLFTFIEIDDSKGFKSKLFTLIRLNQYEQIKALCQKHKNSISKTVLQLLQNTNNLQVRKNELDFAIEDAINTRLQKLESRNWILELSTSASPQLGLLGTIVGMIKAFGALSVSSDSPMVATGISEALYTTAFGLIVAIPCLILHIIVNKKIDTILNTLNSTMSLFSRHCEKVQCESC